MPLEDYVLKYNPIDRTAFRQADWLSQVGDIASGGRCYGFALAYLLALSKGAPGKDFLETLNIAAAQKDPAVINEIVANSKELEGTDKWVGTDFFNLQFSDSSRDRVFGAFGLAVENEVRFMHKNRKFDDLADYVATNDTRLSLLCVPNHALAATSRPAGEAVWTFFDPNLGEASFRSQTDLHECIANFFSAKKIKKAYRRKEVASLASGATLERQKQEVAKMTVDVLRLHPA